MCFAMSEFKNTDQSNIALSTQCRAITNWFVAATLLFLVTNISWSESNKQRMLTQYL